MTSTVIVRNVASTIQVSAAGPTGPGVVAGGTTGQVLAKVNNEDFNTQWVDQSGGGAGTFTSLTDVPNNIIANQFIQGNAGATALEFTTISISDVTDLQAELDLRPELIDGELGPGVTFDSLEDVSAANAVSGDTAIFNGELWVNKDNPAFLDESQVWTVFQQFHNFNITGDGGRHSITSVSTVGNAVEIPNVSGTMVLLTDQTPAGQEFLVRSGAGYISRDLIFNDMPDLVGLLAITAERTVALTSDTYQWGFGDGASTPNDSGIVIPFNYEIVYLCATNNGVNDTWTVQAERNGVVFTIAAQVGIVNARSAVNTFAAGSRPQGNAGDRLNFKTLTVVSSTSPCTVVAYVRPR